MVPAAKRLNCYYFQGNAFFHPHISWLPSHNYNSLFRKPAALYKSRSIEVCFYYFLKFNLCTIFHVRTSLGRNSKGSVQDITVTNKFPVSFFKVCRGRISPGNTTVFRRINIKLKTTVTSFYI